MTKIELHQHGQHSVVITAYQLKITELVHKMHSLLIQMNARNRIIMCTFAMLVTIMPTKLI